ncbi:MAG TPA: gas vesicle protein GvpD P-loop domain-containing protein [Thermoplasmata archaeon]|nr:gas vesicle protein GvpD P-loop domain-containing protein [Thermoplasmata archaeon]
MGAILPLPTELTSFLRRATPQALLVRGPPGTGKSTLAFALLQSFAGRRIYVSGRVPRRELAQDFPWISGEGPHRVSVVESAEPTEPLQETLRAIEKAPRLVASPAALPLLRSLLLPPEGLDAWTQTSSDGPTMVVLDPWDAIVERHLGRAALEGLQLPPRPELERIALSQLASGPVFLVIVVEDRTAGQLEYLVNGIVTLDRTSSHDRLERWLDLDKLRGIRIESPRYPFSLEAGRFQCAARLDPRTVARLGRGDPEPDVIPGTIWPGSVEYATHFGRPHVGRLTVLTKDLEVPDSAVNLLLAPLITQVLRKRGPILHILPPRVHPDDVWQSCQGFLNRDEFLRFVRILSPSPPDPADPIAEAILPFRPKSVAGSDPRAPEALRFIRESQDQDRPGLSVIWSSGLRALNAVAPGAYQPETLPSLATAYFHRSFVHQVYIGMDGDPLTDSLFPMAETRIHLASRSGRVFVYASDPPTPYLVLSAADEAKPYRLLLVV